MLSPIGVTHAANALKGVSPVHEDHVAGNTHLLQLLCSLDPLPGGRDPDEHPILGYLFAPDTCKSPSMIQEADYC